MDTSLVATYLGVALKESGGTQTPLPIQCPVCGTQVLTDPIKIMVALPNGSFNGQSTLIYPSYVCPRDGLIFCVFQ